jgi:hypothetical protein
LRIVDGELADPVEEEETVPETEATPKKKK